MVRYLLIAAVLLLAACEASEPKVPIYGYKVVQAYPHDSNAYCQGLLIDKGQLYESTGKEGQSTVRRVALETGVVESSARLPGRLFGEGLAMHGGELYQLTWHAGRVHVFDPGSLEIVRTMRYAGEGWGITSDGEQLIMSDGSSYLAFRDPETFKLTRRLQVTILGTPLDQLNELEWVDGEIWANRWKHDYIVRIDPATGEIVGSIDLRGLYDYRSIGSNDAVLNGIAYDAQAKRLFVTGKLWSKLFEIELTD